MYKTVKKIENIQNAVLSLGQHIRELRLSKNVSFQEIAPRLDVSPAFISKVETGRVIPSKHQVILLAGYFGIPATELLIVYQKQRILQEEITEKGEPKSNLIKNKKAAFRRYQNMMYELQQLHHKNLYIQTTKPGNQLSPYIESISFYAGHNFNHRSETVMPDGGVKILIELDDRERRLITGSNRSSTKIKRAWVTGVQKEFLTYLLESEQTILSLQFQTGGFYALTGIPQSEIENTIVEAEAIFGRSILQMREKMLTAKSNQDIFLMAENYFMQNMKEPKRDTERRVVAYVCSHIHEPLDSLVSKSGYSHKHLLRFFKKHLGITPKYFQRISRFNKALAAIHSISGTINWTEISLGNNYFDQAHFIKEFNRFAGMNPGSYLAAGSTCSKLLYHSN